MRPVHLHLPRVILNTVTKPPDLVQLGRFPHPRRNSKSIPSARCASSPKPPQRNSTTEGKPTTSAIRAAAIDSGRPGILPEPASKSRRVQTSIYVCPMDPEVRQTGPGICPKCGMALEPEIATADEGPNPGTDGYDPAILDRSRRQRSGHVFGHGRIGAHAPVVSRVGGGSLCRSALAAARMELHRQSKSEHVHPDRHRHQRPHMSTAPLRSSQRAICRSTSKRLR